MKRPGGGGRGPPGLIGVNSVFVPRISTPPRFWTLNPEITCGFFLSNTSKSSFFKSPTARPCESRTTTGTNTAFTVTAILGESDCGTD